MAKHDRLRALLERHQRIEGPLGDMTKVDPNATPGERLRQRNATLTPDEKVEVLRRIFDLVDDTCECGGSIQYNDHAEGCALVEGSASNE